MNEDQTIMCLCNTFDSIYLVKYAYFFQVTMIFWCCEKTDLDTMAELVEGNKNFNNHEINSLSSSRELIQKQKFLSFEQF